MIFISQRVLKHKNRIVKWKKGESNNYSSVQGKFNANALPQAGRALISAATPHYPVGFPQYHHVNIRGAIIRRSHQLILVLLAACNKTGNYRKIKLFFVLQTPPPHPATPEYLTAMLLKA